MKQINRSETNIVDVRVYSLSRKQQERDEREGAWPPHSTRMHPFNIKRLHRERQAEREISRVGAMGRARELYARDI